MKQLFTTLIVLLLFTTCYAQMPTTGLVAWYPFNGNANDATGNGNNGTVNGATLTTDRFGNANRAYDFNGTSNNITGTATTFPIAGNGRTVSAWFTAGSAPGTSLSYVLTGYGSASQNCGTVFGTLLWNQLSPGVKSVGSWQGCNGSSPDVIANYNYSLNAWYHLVITYVGGQEKVYVNDSLINTSTIGTINTSGGIFRFGSALSNNSWHMGKIDDIAIYGRALSACEVHKLYDTTLPFTSTPQNVATTAGGSVRFAAHASSPTATYQWQLNSGSGFANLINAAPYSGINSDTLRINPVTAAMSNYQFRCILGYLSRPCYDTSSAATLQVMTTGITQQQASRMSVYPNPFTKELNVNLAGAAKGSVSIRLLDVSGRIVWMETAEKIQGIAGTYRMSGEQLTSGFYTVQLYDDAALIATAKIIKQ